MNLKPIDMATVHELEEKCYEVRKTLLTLVYNIGLGHLGGELSMVEAAVAMYYRYMNFDVFDPHNPDRDRFILSKGHCSETLYSIFSNKGAYTMEYMVENFECRHAHKQKILPPDRSFRRFSGTRSAHRSRYGSCRT